MNYLYVLYILAVVCDEGSGLVRLFHETVFEEYSNNMNNEDKEDFFNQCNF